VELYVNHTGLMWEAAPEFGALLVFAEHRYYGLSLPFSAALAEDSGRMAFLTSEQALADFAALIYALRAGLLPGAAGAPVVAFGGSYGGMLAAWLRIHYPSAVDGAVAGSAPIWALAGGEPAPDAGGFAAVVTRDMGAAPPASAPAECADNMRAAWRALAATAEWPGGLSALTSLFRLCPSSALSDAEHAQDLAFWLQSAFDYIAMGNFPYASDYLTNGDGQLPAWPMRAACSPLAAADLRAPGAEEALLTALRDGAAVFYNVSGDVACYDLSGSVNDATARDGRYWSYQACTEMVMPMSRDGVRDAFWPQPYDAAAEAAGCAAAWRVAPRPAWATVSYGGRHLRAVSNIVFSNGGLDPWRYGGVTHSLSRTLLAIDIPEGAHHLDLMFAHPADPESVRAARALHRREIARWLREAYRGAPPAGGDEAPPPRRGAALVVAGAAGACASAAVAAVALLCQRGGWRGGEEADADAADRFRSSASTDGSEGATQHAARHPWDPHAPLLPSAIGGDSDEEA